MTGDEIRELLDLLDEYGEAKLGDDWWPGMAEEWLGKEKAQRMNELRDKALTA